MMLMSPCTKKNKNKNDKQWQSVIDMQERNKQSNGHDNEAFK
jgi:hypothetical protein